jgi:hypothetical protein
MKLRMTRTRRGSPDGVRVETYEKGEVYGFRTGGERSLAAVFLREGWAVEVLPKPKSAKAKRRRKDLGAAPENK